MLRLIGQALLAQHRVSGRVAVEEKPDVLWDRPDLERLYARLEDEYELKERAGVLKRKLDVIVETAHALTDIIDADRATRLECGDCRADRARTRSPRSCRSASRCTDDSTQRVLPGRTTGGSRRRPYSA